MADLHAASSQELALICTLSLGDVAVVIVVGNW